MEYRFSQSSKWYDTNILKEVLKAAQEKDVISFAGGLPSEDSFPLDAIQTAFFKVMEQGKSTLQYGVAEGYKPLREALCARMATQGMYATPDEILVTTGSQQIIDLTSRIFIDPGDVVLVESPTFFGATPVFQSRGARIISVSGDKDGMDMEDLQRKIDEFHPKFVYVVPTFSNPEGKVWSVERRIELVNICRESNVLILEDDPYGALQFTNQKRYPSIFSLDNNGQAKGNCVIYMSTFSKIVAPALRTGWAIGDPAVIDNLVSTKRVADTHSSSLDQQTLYQLLLDFDLDDHIRTISNQYGEKMKIMTDLLKKHAWPGAYWNEPEGGMFLWVELPKHIDTNQLLEIALREGVAFVPSAFFYVQEPKHNMMRINFTHANEEIMSLGLNILTNAIELYDNTYLTKSIIK